MGRKALSKKGFSFKQYYKEHRVELLRKKKERYAKDAKYKKDAKKRSRLRYLALRAKKPILDRKTIIGKRGERYLTIGKLSIMINRGQDAIRRYHKRGVIPMPKHFDTRGWRLYSVHEALVLQEAFVQLDRRLLSNLTEVARFIKSKWRKK